MTPSDRPTKHTPKCHELPLGQNLSSKQSRTPFGFVSLASPTTRRTRMLRDPALLEAFELEMTTLRASEPLPAVVMTRHYRRVHYHLFQDVYSWAGKYRTVRTANLTIRSAFRSISMAR